MTQEELLLIMALPYEDNVQEEKFDDDHYEYLRGLMQEAQEYATMSALCFTQGRHEDEEMYNELHQEVLYEINAFNSHS